MPTLAIIAFEFCVALRDTLNQLKFIHLFSLHAKHQQERSNLR